MGIISGSGSFRGRFGDHFRVGDHFGVGIISGAVQFGNRTIGVRLGSIAELFDWIGRDCNNILVVNCNNVLS